MKVVVIGGGLLGLVAAWELSKKGALVVVLERDTTPGGLCRSFKVNDSQYERYHHFVTSADHNLVELINELELEKKLTWGKALTANLTEKGLVPLDGPFDLLRFPKIPLWQKARFGMAMALLVRQTNWRDLEHISAVEWIEENGGGELYNQMWRSLFEKKFGDKARQTPLSWFWARSRRRVGKRIGKGDEFGLVKGSLQILADKLVQNIEKHGGEVHARREVKSIEPDQAGLFVKTADGESRLAEKVIFTAPMPTLAKAAPGLPEDFRKQCLAVEYSGIINGVFTLSKSLSPYFWLNVSIPDLPFVGIIETTKLLDDPKEHVVYLPRYLDSNHRDFSKEKGELLDSFKKGLLEAFPDLASQDIISEHVFIEPLADPYYSLDYSKMLVEHKTPMAGLFCFNTAQIYPITRSANSSILFGKNAAEMVLK